MGRCLKENPLEKSQAAGRAKKFKILGCLAAALVIATLLARHFASHEETKWLKPGQFPTSSPHRLLDRLEKYLRTTRLFGGMVLRYRLQRVHIHADSGIWFVPRGQTNWLLPPRPILTNESGCAVWVLNRNDGLALRRQISVEGAELNGRVLLRNYSLEDRASLNTEDREDSSQNGVLTTNVLEYHVAPTVEKTDLHYAIDLTFLQARISPTGTEPLRTNLEAACEISVPFEGMVVILGGVMCGNTNRECWFLLYQSVTDPNGMHVKDL